MRLTDWKPWCMGLISIGLSLTGGYAQVALPKVMPPSPETAALFKFVDYPVDYSTGVTDISIPLFEVKSGSLSVPISISYHASGRKVTDMTGPVGLGWSLNCGGAISRTIYGKPDEEIPFPSTMKQASNLVYPRDYSYLAGIYYQDNPSSIIMDPPMQPTDAEFDIYAYQFGSASGKFIMHPSTREPVLIPTKPYQVKSTPGFGAFPSQMVDEQGRKYVFGSAESGKYTPKDRGVSSRSITTASYLSTITSPDNKVTISFTYKSFLLKRDFTTESTTIKDDYHAYGINGVSAPATIQRVDRSGDLLEYTQQRVSEITFKEGKVVFTLDGTTDQVKTIAIRNAAGTTLKTYEFTYSTLDAGTRKLDKLELKDNTGAVLETYSFGYNASESFTNRSRDYWGYRNGTSQLSLLPSYEVLDLKTTGTGTPSYNVNNGSVLLSIRQAVPSFMTRGMLNKITYPTKGTTEFTYEGNPIPGLFAYGPGVRIAQTKTTDDQGHITLKTYEYPTTGKLAYYPYGSGDNYSYRLTETYAYNLSPPICASNLASDPRTYGYHRRRTYSSEIDSRLAYFFDQPVTYNNVTVYEGTATVNTGKTVYTYTAPSVGSISSFSSKLYYPSEFILWKSPVLNFTEVYANVAGSYQLKKTIGQSYTDTEGPRLQGLSLYKYDEFPADDPQYRDSNNMPGSPLKTEYCQIINFTNPIKVFLVGNTYVSLGKRELTGTTETEYYSNGSVIKNTTYAYHANTLLKQTTQTVNNGNVLITKPVYVSDAPYVTTLPYSTLFARNQLGVVVEQVDLKNTIELRRVKTTYKDWGNGIIAPELVSTSTRGTTSQSRLAYQAYDADGNLRQVAKDKGSPLSYLWGYQNVYPIAEVKNAAVTQVLHTSFEEETNSVNFSTDGYTGRKSLKIPYAVTVPTAGNKYVLTYWKKTTAVPKWTLQPPVVISANTSIGGGVGDLIDEVRLYPLGAQMTTYTYDPLVGVTSSTDANNVTTYFEYDGIGRLKRVKDQNGHIRKHYTYHYKGQQ